MDAPFVTTAPDPQARRPAITCPSCFWTTHHPRDVQERYCGRCDQWHVLMDLPATIPAPPRTGPWPTRQEKEAILTAPADAHVFLRALVAGNPYWHPKPLPGGRYGCIAPFGFTWGIITGRIGDQAAITDRWCYGTREAAEGALQAWNGHGEPVGWHRHPATGRRLSRSDVMHDDDGNEVPPGVVYVRR